MSCLWITSVDNLWQDTSGLALDDAGDPTAYFWVHLLLAVTSFLLGTAIGVIEFRGVRALRRESSHPGEDGPSAPPPASPSATS